MLFITMLVTASIIVADIVMYENSFLPNWLGFILGLIGFIVTVLYCIALFLKMVHEKNVAKQLFGDIPRVLFLAISPVFIIFFIMIAIDYLR